MFRALLSFLSSKGDSRTRSELDAANSSDHVLLRARVERPRVVGLQSRTAVQTPILPTTNHRARLLSMELRHMRLCSEKRCDRLARVGIMTAGDLVAAEPLQLTKRLGLSTKAVATLRRYQHAIKLAASVPGLMPRDAMLLVAIHRRTVRALSLDTPALLHRDLERYAMSSRGQRQLRGRRLPSLRRVRKWVDACTASKLGIQ